MPRPQDESVPSPLTRAKVLAADLLAANGLAGWEVGFHASKQAASCVRPFAGRPGRVGLSRAFALRATEAEVRDAVLQVVDRALAPPGLVRGRVRAARGRSEPASVGSVRRKRGVEPAGQ